MTFPIVFSNKNLTFSYGLELEIMTISELIQLYAKITGFNKIWRKIKIGEIVICQMIPC